MFVEGGLHPEQVKALRSMSIERRAELSLGFIRSMRQLKAAALRSQHPEWSEDQVMQALRQSILHGRS